MKSPSHEPKSLVSGAALIAFLNKLLQSAASSEDTVYRLVTAKKLPAGKFSHQIVASPAKLCEFFARVAIGSAGDLDQTGAAVAWDPQTKPEPPLARDSPADPDPAPRIAAGTAASLVQTGPPRMTPLETASG